jgi:signal transduction histidine kinase
MTHGLGRWAAIGAAVSLVVTIITLGLALAAGASARASQQELSQRLVPAAAAAGALLAGYTAESDALHNYVTAGPKASVTPFRAAAGQMSGYQARLAALVRSYPHMSSLLATEQATLQAWLARVAGPQLAAAARGDFAGARVVQASPRNRPYTLAVRAGAAAMQTQIISAQRMVVAKLGVAEGRLLTALAVVCAVVVVVAAGSVVAVRRWLLRPFAQLHRAAEAVAAGQYDTRVPAVGPAELAELGRATERMRTQLVAALAEAERAQSKLRSMNETLGQQVQQRTAHLEIANKNLATFTYSAAHDVRTPLRAISGYAEILAEDYGDRLDEAGRSYAGRIQAAAGHMGALLDGLSQLSQVSQADIRRQDVNLSAEATTLCDQFRARDLGRRVHVTIEDGIRVTADPSLIRTALYNLLDNAWRYTAGRDDATIEVASTPVTGTCICCYVRDNGVGFDPAYTDKLFQPFQRLHDTGEYGGAGIGTGIGTGLATVRRIVERHGGRAWAEGAVGQGATFYLTLDAPDPATSAEAADGQVRVSAGSAG